MFECVVCGDRTNSFRYGTRHEGDYVPLCSRRCRGSFLEDPSQFLPLLEELPLVG
jgi:hypothetical protein